MGLSTFGTDSEPPRHDTGHDLIRRDLRGLDGKETGEYSSGVPVETGEWKMKVTRVKISGLKRGLFSCRTTQTSFVGS